MYKRYSNIKRQTLASVAHDKFNLSRVDIEASERVKDYVHASSSEATLRAYKSDLEHFVAWGQIADFRILSIFTILDDVYHDRSQ